MPYHCLSSRENFVKVARCVEEGAYATHLLAGSAAQSHGMCSILSKGLSQRTQPLNTVNHNTRAATKLVSAYSQGTQLAVIILAMLLEHGNDRNPARVHCFQGVTDCCARTRRRSNARDKGNLGSRSDWERRNVTVAPRLVATVGLHDTPRRR